MSRENPSPGGLRLPKELRDLVGSGAGSFEDDDAVAWKVELESAGVLPDDVRQANPDAQVFANNGVGDLMFLIPKEEGEALDDRVFVFRHEGPEVEELGQRLGALLDRHALAASAHPTVHYHGSEEAVQLGDRVEMKLWMFLRRQGEVVYVPGISPRKPSMERDGLAWVGVRLDNKYRVDVIVNPDSGRLQKDVRKLSR